jgi:WD domain, G-beta repeat
MAALSRMVLPPLAKGRIWSAWKLAQVSRVLHSVQTRSDAVFQSIRRCSGLKRRLLSFRSNTGSRIPDKISWRLRRFDSQILNRPLTPDSREELIEDLKQMILCFYPGRQWGQLRGQERTQRNTALGILGFAASIFFLLAGLATWEAIRARTLQLIAESRALAAESEQMLEKNKGIALEIFLQAWAKANTAQAQAGIADSFPQLLTVLEGHTGSVNQASFSPDGKWIVTAGADSTARLWDAATGRLRRVLRGQTGIVYEATFSLSGDRVLTASSDHTARIWDAVSGGN